LGDRGREGVRKLEMVWVKEKRLVEGGGKERQRKVVRERGGGDCMRISRARERD
jgi:hypothetical protein